MSVAAPSGNQPQKWSRRTTMAELFSKLLPRHSSGGSNRTLEWILGRFQATEERTAPHLAVADSGSGSPVVAPIKLAPKSSLQILPRLLSPESVKVSVKKSKSSECKREAGKSSNERTPKTSPQHIDDEALQELLSGLPSAASSRIAERPSFVAWLCPRDVRKRSLLVLGCFGLAIAVILVVILSIAGGEAGPQVCSSASCNYYAKVLKDSLNASLDPCHDFYEYVCSRRDRGHIGPFKELVYSEFIRSVSDKNEFTSAPPEGQSAVQKAAMFHKSCLDVYTGNGSELEALKRALTECGVFWPKLSNESNLLAMTFALSATYAWAPVLVFLPRRAGHVIVSPSRSFQSRQSRRQAMLEFSRGRYVEYWRFMVDTIGPGNEIEVLPYEELVQLESKVSPALRDAYAAASIVKIENASLSDVVKLAGNAFSRSAWEKELLEHINFPGINSSTPYVFDIMNVRFFDAFFHLVGEVGEDRMAYYVGWAAAQDLSLLSNARLIRQKYLMDADASRGHATFCANFSNYYMGLAFYADYIRSAYLGSYLPRAVGIVKGVREHFGQGFSSSTAWKTLTLRGYMQSLSEDSAATNDPLEFLSVAREERLNVLYEHFPNMISDIFENVKRAAMGHRETAADMAMPRFVQNGRVRFHYLNKDGRPKLLPVVLEPTFFSPDAPPGIKYATLGGEVADAFSSAVFRRLSGDHDDAATTAVVSDLLCLKDTRVDAGMVSPFPALSGSSVQLKLAKKLVSLDALFGAFLDDTGGEQQLRLAEYSTLTGRQTLFAFWCLMQCGVPDGKRGCNVPLRLFQPFAAAFECREGGAMSTPRHCG